MRDRRDFIGWGKSGDEVLPADIRALLSAYRESLPDHEPDTSFMPDLWRKIEGRRSFTYGFGRLAKGLVSAAFALALLMSAVFLAPSSKHFPNTSTYVEVLADAHADETLDAALQRTDSL